MADYMAVLQPYSLMSPHLQVSKHHLLTCKHQLKANRATRKRKNKNTERLDCAKSHSGLLLFLLLLFLTDKTGEGCSWQGVKCHSLLTLPDEAGLHIELAAQDMIVEAYHL